MKVCAYLARRSNSMARKRASPETTLTTENDSMVENYSTVENDADIDPAAENYPVVENVLAVEPTSDACIQLKSDMWDHCAVPGFIGNIATKPQKNARLIAVNLNAIPTCAAKCREKGSTPLFMGVIFPLAKGFSKAPYFAPAQRDQKVKAVADAEPLSELENEPENGKLCLTLWPFAKAGSGCAIGSRGSRMDDQKVKVEGGDVIIGWVSMQDFATDKMNHFFSADLLEHEEIPPFTMLEIEICTKNGEKELRNGEAHDKTTVLKIARINSHNLSLLSYVPEFKRLPTTLVEAKIKAMQKRELYKNLERDISVDNLFWHTKIGKKAWVNEYGKESDSFVSIHDWRNSEEPGEYVEHVDIAVNVLLRYTNSINVEWSIALLQLAIASGALDLVVIHSDYFKRDGRTSSMRAIPLIDTRQLFATVRNGTKGVMACVNSGELQEKHITVPSGFRYMEADEREYPIYITVIEKDHAGETTEGPEVPCNDLILYDGQHKCDKAVKVMFSVQFEQEKRKTVLLVYLRESVQQRFGNVKRAKLWHSE